MKSILFITPFTPDNQGVGVSYTSQLLKELAKTCFIDLVYFRYEDDKPYEPSVPKIRIIREEIISSKDKIKSLVSSPLTFPLFTARYNNNVCAFIQRTSGKNSIRLCVF